MDIRKHEEIGIAIPVTKEGDYLIHVNRPEIEVLFMAITNVIDGNSLNNMQRTLLETTQTKLGLAVLNTK